MSGFIAGLLEGLSLEECAELGLAYDGDGDRLILFVASDGSANGDIEPLVKDALRSQLSPRHVPNEVYTVPAIPTTLSGKKLEVPVKKILAGADPDEVASRGSLRDPAALDAIAEVAATRNRRLRWDEASRAFAGEGETPRPVSRRREELLELAAEMFAEHGFTGVTVDSLGSAAGVSGPALYHHFDSKEAMLGEMLVGISHHLLDRGRALRDADLGDRLLTELIAMHVDFAVDHQALILVHMRDLNQAHADDQRRVRLLQRQYTEVWVEALLEHTPDLPPDTARAAIHGVLGLINSTPFSPRAERDEMVRLLQEMAGASLAAVRPAQEADMSELRDDDDGGAAARLGRLRSLLFAPATNEAVMRKIGTRGADAVVIDCEDATPPHLKEAAREAARTLAPVLTAEGTVVTVRVNAPSSEWFTDDIAEALTPAVAAVVVPKIERVDEIDHLARLLDAAGLPELGVIAGIETALGVADARHLLAHPRIVAGYFGAEEEPVVVEDVCASGARILLVAMGAPRQESFILRHRRELGARVALGIGGSFDVWSGRVRRAPEWTRRYSVEWLWRLASNPRRAGRQVALASFVRDVMRHDEYGRGRSGRG